MKVAVIERMDYPDGKDSGKRYSMSRDYPDILNALGCVVVPVITSYGIEEIAQFCDWLIISGNAINIPPQYYGELPLKGLNYDIDTYALDSAAIKAFHDLNKPILGICGGHQSINVYFGGSLHQHIEHHALDESNRHFASVKENTFIHKVFQQLRIQINSLHSQCVNRVADGFDVSAISEDGIIEAIEKDNIIGVQWHPEMMNDAQFFKIFIDQYMLKGRSE